MPRTFIANLFLHILNTMEIVRGIDTDETQIFFHTVRSLRLFACCNQCFSSKFSIGLKPQECGTTGHASTLYCYVNWYFFYFQI